jgi:hypothetical protein
VTERRYGHRQRRRSRRVDVEPRLGQIGVRLRSRLGRQSGLERDVGERVLDDVARAETGTRARRISARPGSARPAGESRLPT